MQYFFLRNTHLLLIDSYQYFEYYTFVVSKHKERGERNDEYRYYENEH